jgi:hypothetical protein
VDKTCKLNGNRRVAIFGGCSGVRVRNTWVICREEWDNSLKGELILHVIEMGIPVSIKRGSQDLRLCDEPAAYQLVGEVMAHQG